MPRTPGLVSVVVTSYNRERYIEESLDSLLRQTYPDVEIIVIDDASTDQTMQKVQAIAQQVQQGPDGSGKRIISLVMPVNIGYAGTLTMGMYLARGEWIAIHDSDDLSHKERLHKQVEYLRQRPDCDLVGSMYREFKDGMPPEKGKKRTWMSYGTDRIRAIYQRGGHCVCWGTTMFRGELFDQWGGLSRKLGAAADYEYLSRLIKSGVRANNIPEVLYYYRRHPEQMSLQVEPRPKSP